MNKLIKGSIAGAVGIALLLGGAGTFALWNSSVTVAGGSVASGVLTIRNSGDASWKDISSTTAKTINSIADFRIVPGDTLELTQVVKVKATGDNLRALLSVDPSTLVATTDADKALLHALDLTLDASATNGGPTLTNASATTWNVAQAAGESTVTLKLKLELPSTVGDEAAQGGTLDLSNVAFKLAQQVRS